MERVRVLVVDDHEVVRVGVVSVLSRERRIEVVGAASSGAEAMRMFAAEQPDVVVLDHRLQDTSGAALCKEMVAQRPAVSVIMLTSFDSDEVIHACLAAGARGYVTKDIENSDLVSAVLAVAEGGVYLAPEITERVVMWARRAKHIEGSRSLTPEEVDILALVSNGMSNKEIANELCLSESSVKARLQSAMRKLGASRRLDAVAAGMRRGVI